MKKIKWLVTLLVVASIALGIIGCDNPSGPDNGGTQEERFVLLHSLFISKFFFFNLIKKQLNTPKNNSLN